MCICVCMCTCMYMYMHTLNIDRGYDVSSTYSATHASQNVSMYYGFCGFQTNEFITCNGMWWQCRLHDNHGPGLGSRVHSHAWWRHQMETFSALLALFAGKSPVTDEFPAQRPVTQSVDVFFDLRLNKRLSKQSWGWWFETPSRPLWRHCNGYRV